MGINPKDIIYDWEYDVMNHKNQNMSNRVEVHDETLRDGLQSASIIQPSTEQKIAMVNKAYELGVDSINIGFPYASPSIYDDCDQILKNISQKKMDINVACAARTVNSDIESIIKLSQKHGVELEVDMFIGTSPIRKLVEGWDLNYILKQVKEAITYAVRNNLKVCFITEDTTRSRPEHLKQIYSTAIESGASRVCVCDTVGASTPESASKVITFIKEVIDESGKDILIDWHGHNDRGLALANSLAAVNAGANRIHCTCLGIGERIGNTATEQLLINLSLSKIKKYNLKSLNEYCMLVSECVGVSIPYNMPIVGEDAFRTSTGVHVSAIAKAIRRNDNRLADIIYSSVPASEVGRNQVIKVGPYSGKMNVSLWLEQHNVVTDDNLVDKILKYAKKKDRILEDDEIYQFIKY